MSEISAKRAIKLMSKTGTPGIDSVNRVFSEIYDHLNEIINAVNGGGGDESSEQAEGKVGDIRVITSQATTDSSGVVVHGASYRLEAKTPNGWASTDLTIIDEIEE